MALVTGRTRAAFRRYSWFPAPGSCVFLISRKRGAFKVARSTSLFAAAIFNVRKSRRLATLGERMKREVDEY